MGATLARSFVEVRLPFENERPLAPGALLKPDAQSDPEKAKEALTEAVSKIEEALPLVKQA